ncbi:MAG: mannitol dehydrogenase family protein, partial [Bifidobacteriaceae bacterium]|nr:mannitol dehydrogenase family protein [Bifidobacteriaceae bacterium]
MVKITDDYMDPVQRQAFQASGIKVPNFAQAELYQPTHNAPVWLHFGGGNIFRVTHADIMQRLIEQGLTDQGIIDVDTFSEDLVLKIYRPFKNRTLSVTLEPQGTEKKLIVTVTEALTVAKRDPTDLARLKEIFRAPSLQLVTFTITEKGYALTDLDGNYLPMIQSDRDSGPETVQSAMGYVTMGLFERWQAGQYPLALVSTDNFSHNGEVLKQSIWDIASAWVEKGYADPKFLDYLNSESTISFPITVIDKITPNPDPDVAHELEKSGYEDYQLVPSPRGVNLATFVNAEATEYLVIEDKFPNGRPALEKAGVYFGDVEMIDK